MKLKDLVGKLAYRTAPSKSGDPSWMEFPLYVVSVEGFESACKVTVAFNETVTTISYAKFGDNNWEEYIPKVEKDHLRIWELESGKEYRCENSLRVMVDDIGDFKVMFNGSWSDLMLTKPWCEKEFTEIRDLKFSDIKVGDVLIDRIGTERELIAIRGKYAITWKEDGRSTGSWEEDRIKNWRKKDD